MQHFDDNKGIRNSLDICNMTVKEADDYYLQVRGIDKLVKETEKRELKARIKNLKKGNLKNEWILAIKDKAGKVIGKIEALQLEPGVCFFTIDIPNESWRFKYGLKAIKYFCKICDEEKYFTKIQFDLENPIVSEYLTAYESKKIVTA